MYTLVYRGSVTFLPRSGRRRIRVTRGNMISDLDYSKIDPDSRRAFLPGQLRHDEVQDLFTKSKGVIPGERPRGGFSKRVDFVTGEEVKSEPEPEEAGSGIPTLPNFKSMGKGDVPAWAAQQDWIPPGTVDPEALKKDNVEAIEQLHRTIFLEPSAAETEAEDEGPGSEFTEA